MTSDAATSLVPSSPEYGAPHLMDAQCWLWGQDIRRPAGNLLLGYGLRRDRWDEGGHATHYAGEVGDTSVVLWSGGMVLIAEGVTVEVPRHHLQPRLWPAPAADDDLVDPRRTHHLGDAPVVDAPPLALDDPHALRVFLWLAEYEAWVAREAPGWRSECATRWLEAEEQARELAASVGVDYDPLPALPPEGLAGYWSALAGGWSARAPSAGAR
jgi:hypothetical protein